MIMEGMAPTCRCGGDPVGHVHPASGPRDTPISTENDE